ncbi:MAG: hypothetical protein NTX32_04905 [Candidatus Firestonebacteria bacterium]|nr:hypothetical protein [Candidatus Firestonebacteria bacterium]
MRNVVSLRLPDELLSKVKKEMKRQDTSFSELMKMALDDYFFKEEFFRLRKKALLQSVKKGKVYSDEDIFKRVS